jgi:4-hydroxy-2-oxoheptanedioate aldolase
MGEEINALDKVREAAAAGLPSFATWVSIGNALAAEVIGKAGYDCVILDTQHGGVGWGDLPSMIQALDLNGARALVRVGWTDQMQIMRAMDLGALGVIVPMVSTAEQARLAAEAIRYPPRGIRSYGPVRNYYAAQEVAFEPLCMVMIETAEALDNLEEIAATPGVDGLFVGPVDLALSLGLGPAMVMPEPVLAAIDRVVEVCRRHGVISGSAALGLPNTRVLIDRGVQFLAQGNDMGFIRRGAAAELEQLNAWREERRSA